MKRYKLIHHIRRLAGAAMLLTLSCRAPGTATTPTVLRSDAPVRITRDGDNTKPCLAARPGGGAYLAWARRSEGRSVICFATADQQHRFGTPIQISANDMALDLGAENGPQMAVTTSRTIYIAWVAGREASANKTEAKPDNRHAASGSHRMPARPADLNIYLAISRDDGKTFSPPQKINDDTGGAEHRFPSLVADDHGRVVIAWLDKRAQSAERPDFSRVYLARSTDGGRSFGVNVDVTQEQDNGICHCCKLALASHPRHGTFVAYRNARDDVREIYLARSAFDGLEFQKPVSIDSSHWTIPGCPMNGPSLAFDRTGRLHALWPTGGAVPGAPALGSSEEDGHKVIYRSFDPRTRTWSEPLCLAIGTHPRLAVDRSGAAYVAWAHNGLHLVRVAGATVTTDESLQISPSDPLPNYPSLALASDGRLLVAWQQQDSNGRMQIFLAGIRREMRNASAEHVP